MWSFLVGLNHIIISGVSSVYYKFLIIPVGGTIRREQKTFARSWVTLEELNTQLREEVVQY